MTRRHQAATRLCAGAGTVVRRRASRLAGWVRGGRNRRRRLARLAVLLLAGLLAWRIVRAAPWLMWVASGWLLYASWRASRSTAAAETEARDGGHVGHDEAEHDTHREDLLRWLETATRNTSGIHLSNLYARLRRRPALAGLSDPQLRAVLDHFEVPVARTLRVGRITGRSGVRRRTIEGLLRDSAGPLPSSAPDTTSTDVESEFDLRKSTPDTSSSDPSQKGSRVEDTDSARHFDEAIHLTH